MEKLYRKIGDDFQEVCISFYGDPEEGVWFISKEGTTVRRTWLCEKVSELPEKMTWASFLPFKEKIIKALWSKFNKVLRKVERGEIDTVTPNEISSIIRRNLK